MSVVSKKTAVVWLVGVFLLLDVAAASWFFTTRKPNVTPYNTPSIYANIPVESNAGQMSGVVLAVSEDSITVAPFVAPGPDVGETTVVPGAPLPIAKSLKKSYTVSAQTKIFREQLRDMATYEAEVKAYKAAYAKNPNSAGAVPSPSTEVALTLSDIRQGAWVTVLPTTEESKDARSIVVVSTGTATTQQ